MGQARDDALYRRPTSRDTKSRAFSIPAPSTTSCSYDASSLSFACARVTREGLSLDQSFILFDAAGNRQSAFVRGSTASVEMKSHAFGTVGVGDDIQTIDMVGDRTVSGLLTSRHVLNGTLSTSFDESAPPQGGIVAPMPMHFTSATTLENLVLPSRDHRWPGPGTMTTVSTSLFGSEPPFITTARAVFNGTKCAVFTFTNGPHTETMTMDLSNPLATSCTP
jgi:hypothetical protein